MGAITLALILPMSWKLHTGLGILTGSLMSALTSRLVSMRVVAKRRTYFLLLGASLPMIMARGRWSKPDTVMRYVEHVALPF